MSEKLSTKPYRGTRDFFPEQMQQLDYIFSVWRKVVQSFGYQEYLTPILESWDLYAAKNVSGEEIVNDQLYWFTDRGERKVAIRPEMTPSVSRLIAQQYPQLPKPIRWYSVANFMRYERPQKSRMREFFQLNVDLFGDISVSADAELIEIAISIMREFGADENMFEIRINNRKYVEYLLIDEFKIEESVVGKVMRIIDRLAKQSVEDTTQQLTEIGLSNEQAQSVVSMSDLSMIEVDKVRESSEGAQELATLFELLDERGVTPFIRFDASLMRGLDYYTGNVFEQFDLNPDNNRSMFGGGRYDGLGDLFGVKNVSATGFAPGDIPTLEFLRTWNLLPETTAGVQVLVTVFNDELRKHSWRTSQALREAGISTELYLNSTDSISSQLTYASKRGIEYVIIIGDGEVDSETVVLKNMRNGDQDVMPLRDVITNMVS